MMDSDEVLSNLFLRCPGPRSRGRQGCSIQAAGRVSCCGERRDEPCGFYPMAPPLTLSSPPAPAIVILRLRGKGAPGLGGGKPGDALVEIEVKPHSFFTREGATTFVSPTGQLHRGRVLGAEVRVPTTTGTAVSRRYRRASTRAASFASRAVHRAT